jgi:hypothetical protein
MPGSRLSREDIEKHNLAIKEDDSSLFVPLYEELAWLDAR